MSVVPLCFQIRDLLWLYIPLVKDIKEKKEDSGERPFVITNTKQSLYELATMTEHYKKPDYQYQIQYETNLDYQGKLINYNTKVYLEEKVLKRIMGRVFNYYKPYRLNEQDFHEFKQRQKKYFTDPDLLGSRYEVKVI
jgi:hypothetical protein